MASDGQTESTSDRDRAKTVGRSIAWTIFVVAAVAVMAMLSLIVLVAIGSPGLSEPAFTIITIIAFYGMIAVAGVGIVSIFRSGWREVASIAIGTFFVVLIGLLVLLYVWPGPQLHG